MQRFFIPAFKPDSDVTLQDERVVFQLQRVLRARAGERFRVFNIERCEWELTLTAFGKKSATARVEKTVEPLAEPALQVTLFQAIPKKPALLELVVQKAVELGAHAIVPMITERTEQRHNLRLDRLNLIALEAAEQCGRVFVPAVKPAQRFEEALKQCANGFLAYEAEKDNDFGTVFSKKSAGPLELFIGPEGGFSDAEIKTARGAGVRTFSLGPRILRTETAGLAALSLMLI